MLGTPFILSPRAPSNCSCCVLPVRLFHQPEKPEIVQNHCGTKSRAELQEASIDLDCEVRVLCDPGHVVQSFLKTGFLLGLQLLSVFIQGLNEIDLVPFVIHSHHQVAGNYSLFVREIVREMGTSSAPLLHKRDPTFLQIHSSYLPSKSPLSNLFFSEA